MPYKDYKQSLEKLTYKYKKIRKWQLLKKKKIEYLWRERKRLKQRSKKENSQQTKKYEHQHRNKEKNQKNKEKN